MFANVSEIGLIWTVFWSIVMGVSFCGMFIAASCEEFVVVLLLYFIKERE